MQITDLLKSIIFSLSEYLFIWSTIFQMNATERTNIQGIPPFRTIRYIARDNVFVHFFGYFSGKGINL